MSAIGHAPEPCRWCGATHGPMCPFVKALEFYEFSKEIKRVEFVVPADMGAPALAPKAEEPEEPDYPRKQPMREAG